MGSLKMELKYIEEEWVENDPPAVVCDVSSLLDALETIDDDEKTAIEEAKSEAECITGAVRYDRPLKTPHEIIGPITDSPISVLEDNELTFQEIEEDCGQIDPERQTEFDRLVETLEGIW